MKKTLKLGFGRQPHNFFNFCFSIFFLVRLESSSTPKMNLLSYLILKIAMKKALKIGFGRRPHNISNFGLNISSS